MNVTLKDLLEEAANELGWIVYRYDNDWEFEKWSPAGEDYVATATGEDVAADLRSLADNFDPEDHVMMWLEAKQNGVKGVPGLRELVDDADAIKDMVGELATALEAVSA